MIAAAEQGDEVLIARNGIAVAKIIAYHAPQIKPPGAWKGLAPYSSAWDSAETNKEVGDLFSCEDDAPAA
ncbi:MAG: type II toxin-antitoxin system Phd/YefM family antitoxin [Candidatus Methylumidiphilus sp.]